MRYGYLLVVLFLLTACSGSTEETEKKDEGVNIAGGNVSGDEQLPKGLQVEPGDLNGDKRADVWRYYKEVTDNTSTGGTRQVVFKKEADLNFDGKKDVFIEYRENGSRTLERFDFDFDGKIDQMNYYGPNDKTKEKHVFAPGTDRVFIWKLYDDDGLREVKQDDNGDGIADTCEEWHKGQRIVREGVDNDSDGVCDTWKDVRE